ncbi:MAG: hypothetical protein CM15mP120_11280 [Pseudomonadota bacterium]|nr:MAG: hypothetical protein CM15mP120_11280 [Pseudomonadota bacterium]
MKLNGARKNPTRVTVESLLREIDISLRIGGGVEQTVVQVGTQKTDLWAG